MKKLSENILSKVAGGVDVGGEISQDYFVYVVKRGDTLFGIAKRFLTKEEETFTTEEIEGLYRELAKLNKIVNPDKIWAGEKIMIPSLDFFRSGDFESVDYNLVAGA